VEEKVSPEPRNGSRGGPFIQKNKKSLVEKKKKPGTEKKKGLSPWKAQQDSLQRIGGENPCLEGERNRSRGKGAQGVPVRKNSPID